MQVKSRSEQAFTPIFLLNKVKYLLYLKLE